MIVLDTHVWVWWVTGARQLSSTAADVIDESAGLEAIYLSSISVWEVALLVERGRLELSMQLDDWIAQSESLPFLHFVPLNNRIALRSITLPGLIHRDPADRIILATTLSLGAKLVTKDDKLRSYSQIETIW